MRVFFLSAAHNVCFRTHYSCLFSNRRKHEPRSHCHVVHADPGVRPGLDPLQEQVLYDRCDVVPLTDRVCMHPSCIITADHCRKKISRGWRFRPVSLLEKRALAEQLHNSFRHSLVNQLSQIGRIVQSIQDLPVFFGQALLFFQGVIAAVPACREGISPFF